MSGLFITLEGIDFCGKSTQAKKLAAYLKRKGYRVLLVREPGGDKVAERIRRVLLNHENSGMTALTELLLYEAARSQVTERIIGPALKENKVVVCDRYADSTLAYQGYGRGLSKSTIVHLNHVATSGISPDLTILLDVPITVSAKRRRLEGRKKDRLEREKREFHQRIREGFLKIAEGNRERIRILDGTGDVDQTWREVKKLVDGLLDRPSG